MGHLQLVGAGGKGNDFKLPRRIGAGSTALSVAKVPGRHCSTRHRRTRLILNRSPY